MQRYKIFVDGSAGTTGLRILDRLAGRPELELISLPEADRKTWTPAPKPAPKPTWCSSACRTRPRGRSCR